MQSLTLIALCIVHFFFLSSFWKHVKSKCFGSTGFGLSSAKTCLPQCNMMSLRTRNKNIKIIKANAFSKATFWYSHIRNNSETKFEKNERHGTNQKNAIKWIHATSTYIMMRSDKWMQQNASTTSWNFRGVHGLKIICDRHCHFTAWRTKH